MKNNQTTTEAKNWNKEWETFWKPLLLTKGEFDEKKIENEMHDLVFIFEQIGEVYMYITGGMLSKPMYYAGVIKTAFDDAVSDAVQEEVAETQKAVAREILVFLDELEMKQPDELKTDNWRNWKYIRNSIVDKYKLAHSQEDREGKEVKDNGR